MFHEEKMINGVLCWRDTLDGEWIPFTRVELTSKFLEERERSIELANKIEDWAIRLDRAIDALTIG